MTSSLFVALEAQVKDLKSFFIVERDDYKSYTQEDHAKALAFRLLASASIEDYVEKRCLEIAKEGTQRMKRSQPTATGRALVTWFTVRKSSRAVSIHDADALDNLDLADEAFKAYQSSVRGSHGIAGKDLRDLVFPLGVRGSHVPEVLVTALDALSRVRDPASHVYINRAKTMAEPVAEWTRVNQLMPLLRQLDEDLSWVVDRYPL